MAQPVWVLSVDLQTKTATFSTGLAGAARDARGSFNDIKADGDAMGRAVSGSMSEARHGVMLLGEEFGVHLPRALTAFIASIGPIGAAMEAAFPFLAIAVGATLLLEHLAKLRQEGNALTESQQKFGTTVANVLNGLNDKLLEAGIKTDELNHNHLGALEKRLQLIDHQSMSELERSFDSVAKAADVSFATLKTAWYSWSAGSTGAKHALEEFKGSYDALLASGNTAGASNLLKGTLDQARAYLTEMRQAKGTLSGDDKQLQSQENLVEALQATVQLEQKVKDLKQGEDKKATSFALKESVEDTKKLAEGNKTLVSDYGKLMNGALEYGKAVREIPKDTSGNKALQETLKDYAELVKAARDYGQARVQASKEAAENEKEVNAASTAAALAFIKGQEEAGLISKRDAIQQELALNESALTEKINSIEAAVAAQVAAYQKEIDAAKQADAAQAALGVKKGDTGYINYLGQVDALQQKTAATIAKANAQEQAALIGTTTQIQNAALATAKLDNSWSSFFGHANSETLTLAATIRGELQSSMTSATNAFSQGIAKSIVEGKSFGKSMAQVAREMSESMISGLIRWGVQDLITKAGMKATAASLAGANATASMAGAPFPVDLGAPAFAASMMGTAMAFEYGGIVPGVTRGDSVPYSALAKLCCQGA
jgi:hypothetical protein